MLSSGGVRLSFFSTLIILAFAAVGSAQSSLGVVERRSSLSCCQSPQIKFEPQYDTTWRIDGETIAWSDAASSACVPPCKEIKRGQITLTDCVDVNATMVYTHGSKVKEETRIAFFGRPCSASPGNHPGSLVLLLAATVVGLTVKTC